MLSDNFSRKEFRCKCGVCDQVAVDYELLAVLEDLRAHFSSPVTITSGNRCPTHNRREGGSEGSKHLLSIASDIRVKGISAKRVYEYLDGAYPNKYGMGLYPSWVHIDVRPERARWWV